MVTPAAGPLCHLGDLSGRRVLVTGHSGFIGSWLCALLLSAGVRVIGYSTSDDPSTSVRADWLKRLGVSDVRGDVRKLPELLAATDEYRPELLIHLAAQPLLRRGFTEPHLTFDTNINGSLSVLEALRLGAIAGLIHVTSDKCYAPAPDVGIHLSESSPIGGESPYPASKAIAEALFMEFSVLLPPGRSMASVRLGNVVGGGDEADRLIPNALRAFRSGDSFSVRDPAAIRPFQHVLDVAIGLSKLAAALIRERIPSGLPLNFAPPDAGTTVGDLIAELARSWGPGAVLGDGPDAVDFPEQRVIQLDGSRAATMLDWHHQLDLKGTAHRTVAWERLVAEGIDPAEATTRQVADFLAGFEGSR